MTVFTILVLLCAAGIACSEEKGVPIAPPLPTA